MTALVHKNLAAATGKPMLPLSHKQDHARIIEQLRDQCPHDSREYEALDSYLKEITMEISQRKINGEL